MEEREADWRERCQVERVVGQMCCDGEKERREVQRGERRKEERGA